VPRIKSDKGRTKTTCLVEETEEDFLHAEGSEINSNSKQQLISTDRPVVRATMGNVLRGNAIYRKIMDR